MAGMGNGATSCPPALPCCPPFQEGMCVQNEITLKIPAKIPASGQVSEMSRERAFTDNTRSSNNPLWLVECPPHPHPPKIKYIHILISRTCVCVTWQSSAQGVLRHVQLFVTPWTVARRTPLSMGFLRQEYWSRLSLPSPGDLPKSGIKPAPLVSPALAGRFLTTVPPGELAESLCKCD